MIDGFSFGFMHPLALIGLVALPIIWWLLRLTPPSPQRETFAPIKILAQIIKTQETPHTSPWWLTLLRLVLAGLIILAMAGPQYNPRVNFIKTGEILALIIDNDWSSAPDFDKRVATAKRLVNDAGERDMPVILAFTSDKANAQFGPFNAREALERLNGARPLPVFDNRSKVLPAVGKIVDEFNGVVLAYLNNGLASKGDKTLISELFAKADDGLIWFQPENLEQIGIFASDNNSQAVELSLRRIAGPSAAQVNVQAFDIKGRAIGETTATFQPNEAVTSASFALPFELRNDFHLVKIDSQNQAAATWLIDENTRRRRIGILKDESQEAAQSLLSPFYYLSRALTTFADIVEAQTADLSLAIPQLLETHPAIIIMNDIQTLPDNAQEQLLDWVQKGGTLLRFAGPRLASNIDQEFDPLLPVLLRRGERALGGTLSWSKPQAIAPYPANSPFHNLPPPQDVLVKRQILAEPSADIGEHTWAALEDGTPLVTGRNEGKGRLILFHVPAEATWSNLPISGAFLDMLQRIVRLSNNQGGLIKQTNSTTQNASVLLPPYQMIGADGSLQNPTQGDLPLIYGLENASVSFENPPGFYGSQDALIALNLFNEETVLKSIDEVNSLANLSDAPVQGVYAFDESVSLAPILLLLACFALIADCLIVFWMGGLMARVKRPIVSPMIMVLALSAALFVQPPNANANDDDQRAGDEALLQTLKQTRLAYVLTGNQSIDDISKAGLTGLSKFILDKTALEPGDPVGLDIERDELSLYPILYWPIDETIPTPSPQAIARIDAFIQQGGSILFDTRDQLTNGLGLGGQNASGSAQKLREILQDINVPALEPVPIDHVLTKSFFLLDFFPGRYGDGPLWTAASPEEQLSSSRPVRVGDGVSPILITGNDFAGAWAIDDNNQPLLPTVPDSPLQRIYAYRAGVNIIMYMLTGNYKSDQVHIPTLMERLGQ